MIFSSSIYSFLLKKVILPIGEFLFKIQLTKNIRFYKELFSKGERDILDFQSSEMMRILQNASENSPFYNSLKLDSKKDTIEFLKSFPIMDKETLKVKKNDIFTINNSSLIRNSTSGSSGVQIEVFVTRDEQTKYRACQTIWWEWAGFEIGKPMLQTGLATKRTLEKRLKDYFFRTYYLFAFGLTQKNVQGAFKWSRSRRPILGGYASSLYILSQLADKENLPINFKSAISWGDKLFDHYKKNIERVFKCKVYETYGASEGLMIAAQKDLEFMYIMLPFVYIEILDNEGNEVADGQIGNVVVTSLIHEAFPLIRYKLGDLAIILPKEKYPSNRELNLPLLQKVVGRETDIVETRSGKKLIVHSFTGIFEYYPSIKQFCIIQSDLDGVEIQYIRDDDFKVEDIINIGQKLRDFVGENFEFRFTEVMIIPPTNSGKPQIIISKLK